MFALLVVTTVAAPSSYPASEPTLSLEVGEANVSQTIEEALAAGTAARNGGLGTRGILTTLKRALKENIIPERSHHEFVAFAKQLLNDAEATTKTNPINDILNDAPPAQRNESDSIHGQGGTSFIKGKLCVGNCGQKHEVFRLTAVLHIDHDEKGVPKAWRLKLPSASVTFNRQILEQAPFLMRLRSPPGEPAPLWSEWSVQAIQYRWGFIERALDSAFLPKSLVSEIQLQAVKYRE